MSLDRAVPVLQVQDVARSIAWYTNVLGFSANPFPDHPPYSFAILRLDGVELMLQCQEDDSSRHTSPRPGWAVYLRMKGGRLLELAEVVRNHTSILRGPERAFYGQVEFEVADLDGYRLCLAEVLGDDAKVPQARA
jgi:catechol 2,3-dioxygenase-like lactoylglutathione lyase family enzyme